MDAEVNVLSKSTPGPGGFGSPPAFPGVRRSEHLVPAHVSPRPGVYSGPLSTATHHATPWLWIAVAAAAAGLLVTAFWRLHRR